MSSPEDAEGAVRASENQGAGHKEGNETGRVAGDGAQGG